MMTNDSLAMRGHDDQREDLITIIRHGPLPVVPVVLKQLGDGQDDQEGERPAHRPQHRLPPLNEKRWQRHLSRK